MDTTLPVSFALLPAADVDDGSTKYNRVATSPWDIVMGKFGSRSIAFRPKPTGTKDVRPKWQNGPFRFLDLPPEIRNEIIEILLLDLDVDPLPLLLACHQTYAEAGSIFFRYIETEYNGLGLPSFLDGRTTRVSSRQYVQDLRMRFCIGSRTESFGNLCPTLRDMAETGRLQNLRIEIGRFFPDNEFWGCDDPDGLGDFCVGPGLGTGQVISAPLYVAKPWFQDFVSFLGDSGIPKTSLYVEAEDHDKFWCMFHRTHPSGKACDGWWKGVSHLLKIDRSSLVKTLMGAVPVAEIDHDT
ncbi:hypothetical protein F4821DRAFT_123769 [Hypoxylon rubiginosum]|uniref:Uncharacterized protein n=1 Tax=Hypoxylon rubiginosum TaxID=110542 RepID=A0ACC0D1Y0_9PEZI|nr:hypothetical protein F4821DRAFT_123769 [Hypoxylon rubiginosum]